MKTAKELQLERDVEKLARDSKTMKLHLPLEKRLDRVEQLVADTCDVLLRTSLAPR